MRYGWLNQRITRFLFRCLARNKTLSSARRVRYLLSGSLRFIHRPELRPALHATPAGVMMTPGKHRTIPKLDGKRPVRVGR